MDEEHTVEDLSTEVVHDSTTDGVAGETDLNLPVDKPTTAVDTLGVQNGTTHDSSVEPEAYPAESPGIPPTAAVAAAAAPLELLPRPASIGAPSSAPTEGEEDMEDGTPSRPHSIGDRRSHEEVDYPPGIEQEPQDDRQQPPAKKIRRRKPDPIKPFNDMLYDLLVFRSQEGHCRVPLDVKSALGRWVANLRTQKSNLLKGYHSTDLNDHRLAVLDSIEFVWDLQQFDSDARWKRQFQELVDFKNEHDHCNVPQSTPLGKWVKMQREYVSNKLYAPSDPLCGRPHLKLFFICHRTGTTAKRSSNRLASYQAEGPSLGLPCRTFESSNWNPWDSPGRWRHLLSAGNIDSRSYWTIAAYTVTATFLKRGLIIVSLAAG
jgi:hypothetical protein